MIKYRNGTLDDSYAVFSLFEETFADLARRIGITDPMDWDDPQKLARMWDERRSLYEHLANTAEHFWIAERDGQLLGFARSTLRDGLRELTEFFVRPGEQSSGVGRELLARAFPRIGAQRLNIIATTDMRAQSRYLKAGVLPRFPIYYFGHEAEAVQFDTDLTFVPLTSEHMEALAEIDQVIIGHRRDVDHTWLMSDREGYLYMRSDRPVGYGYAGIRNGPFALLDNRDYPAVLAHAENQVIGKRKNFGVEVPMINRAAVDYLLSRNFRIDTFIALFMSDEPFGKFENYILTSPPFFM